MPLQSRAIDDALGMWSALCPAIPTSALCEIYTTNLNDADETILRADLAGLSMSKKLLPDPLIYHAGGKATQ
jgi:hypothetical protein